MHEPDSSFTSLRTSRLLVRRFRASDAATLAAYRSDPDVARYQGWTVPYTQEAAERFVVALDDQHPGTPGDWFKFAVEERATGTHLGDLALHTHDDPRVATVGVTFAAAARGRGYATEALGALLDHLFTVRRLHRVIADCDPRNHAAIALLRRLGFRHEGHHLASYWDATEGWLDEDLFALLADEWPVGAG
jgi:RimJ/RimL family protein N-acetyltransferase